MRYLIAVLLSAALIWTVQQETPVNKSFADTAKAKPVQVVAPEKATEQAQTQTEQEPVNEPAPVATPEPPVPSTHEELMAAAGINPADYGAVDYIISHESSWNANAVNPASGSCGLIQELPCGKSGCTLGDGVCQLRWASQYATERYGSWWGAQAFWQAHSWW